MPNTRFNTPPATQRWILWVSLAIALIIPGWIAFVATTAMLRQPSSPLSSEAPSPSPSAVASPTPEASPSPEPSPTVSASPQQSDRRNPAAIAGDRLSATGVSAPFFDRLCRSLMKLENRSWETAPPPEQENYASDLLNTLKANLSEEARSKLGAYQYEISQLVQRRKSLGLSKEYVLSETNRKLDSAFPSFRGINNLSGTGLDEIRYALIDDFLSSYQANRPEAGVERSRSRRGYR